MKKYLKIIWVSILALSILSCSEDDGLESVQADLPSNLDASFSIRQNNSGEVTITPSGENTNRFYVDYGDGSDLSDTISVGERFVHTYDEGEYEVSLYGMNLAGDEAQTTKSLTVSFLPPEDLEVTIQKSSDDPFTVNVNATAVNAIGFEVDFGENSESEVISFMEDETASYTYSDVGEYNITVTALSGGEATTEYTETVTISDPLLMPITFESETVEYLFTNFGGGEAISVVENPDPNAVNDSQNVASYTKIENSETWAGTSTLLSESIDFSNSSTVSVDVYSPEAGIPVMFKIENADNADIFVESLQNTTTSGEWETMTFSLADADFEATYNVVSLFFNFNTAGTGEMYYFDNIQYADQIETQIPLDFEDGANLYQFTEFEGAPVNIEANPDPSEVNNSANVAKMFKVEGAADYAGAFMDLDNPADFTISDQMTVKVWSPVANVPVTIKFEDPTDNTIAVEAVANIPEANTWVEVDLDFSGVNPDENWSRMVVFFNFGELGMGNNYFFDDIQYSN